MPVTPATIRSLICRTGCTQRAACSRQGSDMSDDSVQEIGPEQIDAILNYLPLFEREGYQFGQWVTHEGQFPFILLTAEVDEFIATLYEQNILVQFDWTSSIDQVERYQSDPDALGEADLLTLRKLLTAHVRADRFVEGHLAGALQSGHITAILRCIKRIRGKTAGST